AGERGCLPGVVPASASTWRNCANKDGEHDASWNSCSPDTCNCIEKLRIASHANRMRRSRLGWCWVEVKREASSSPPDKQVTGQRRAGAREGIDGCPRS